MPEKPTAILVVDDDDTNRDLLTLILKNEEYQILTAEDGRVALDILNSQAVDLVLLDLMMPVIDGYQVLRVMNADNRLKNIPVIIITAVGKIESVKHCIQLGASDYLLKPYNQDIVRNRISAILARKRLQLTEQRLTRQIENQRKLATDLSDFAVPISLKLSEERNFNSLADHIVLDTMTYCHAEAGILYTRTPNDTLKFEVVKNRTMDIALGGNTDQPCPYQPLLIMSDKSKNEPNNRFAVTHSLHQKKQINLNLDQDNRADDLITTRFFNETDAFRAISFLITPIISPMGTVIGILELINTIDPENGLISAFNKRQETVINTYCQIVSVVMQKHHLHKQIDRMKNQSVKQPAS